MPFRTWLAHRWKRALRSVSLARNALRSILTVFMGLYGTLAFLGAGWAFPFVVRELVPGSSPLGLLNAYLLIGLLVLTALRFFLQGASGEALRPYLHLPIARSRLVGYQMVASLASWFNILPLCALVPVALQVEWPGGAVGALCWWIGVLGALAVSHYAALGLRAMLGRGMTRFLAVTGGLGALVGADIALGLGLSTGASGALFGGLAAGGVGPLAVVVGAVGAAAALTVRVVRRTLWADRGAGAASRGRLTGAGLDLGDSLTARLVALDLRLILRNRRPRQLMGYQAVALPLLGVLVAISPERGLTVAHIMLGLFASSLLAIGYGQFIFAWDGGHFDGLLARVAPPDTLLRARLFTLCGLGAVSYLPMLPVLAWVDLRVLWISAVGLIYNLGVTVGFTLLTSLWNRKAFDLNEQAFFNYQGFSSSQFLLVFLFTVPPIVVFLALPFGWALGIVGGVGALGIALMPWWMRALAGGFARRRHTLAAGYRSE
ncbi:MAG: hypothetical protein GVY35_02750 [Bacteroidetes bacterium]|jgi:hypothetical protein|nr:hypothetical protein [Bacteroidota bacterium]